MNWQPIETAPKDGTSVILLMDDVAIEGRWISGGFSKGWSVFSVPSHGCGCCGNDDPEPTHWMPLPKLPPEQTS